MKDIELRLTPSERAAVLHSLTDWEPTRPGRRTGRSLEHFLFAATGRVRQMQAALEANSRAPLHLTDSDLDREVLQHVVESTTWISLHQGMSHQKQSSAFGAMQSVAQKLEQAFGLKRHLKVPLD